MNRYRFSVACAYIFVAFVSEISQSAEITVSGSGNVGIASMSGGTVQLGLTSDEVRALVKATAQEQAKLLAVYIQRINAGNDTKLRRDAISLGSAQAFLATIKGKKVPESEWPEVFGNLARQYLQLGIRIEATPVSSDEIKNLVEQANAARAIGDFERADTFLAQAAEIAVKNTQRSAKQVVESNRQAASLFASRAALAFTRLERGQGAMLLELASDLRKEDESKETVLWLVEAGEAWLVEGKGEAALRVYKRAQIAANSILKVDPSNVEARRSLANIYDNIGDIQVVQGDSSLALKSFHDALSLREEVSAKDSTNAYWQRDISTSHYKIGGFHLALGNSVAALESFQTVLERTERLVASDPSNPYWQGDLSSINMKIGDIHFELRDNFSALKSYESALIRTKQQLEREPKNTQWQRNLSIVFTKIGDTYFCMGDNAASLNNFELGRTFAEQLVEIDPRKFEWQRGLSASYNRIGDIQVAQGNKLSALKSYQHVLSRNERLALSDPQNTLWLRDIVASNMKIGDINLALGEKFTALISYELALARIERLLERDPRNIEWQLDLVSAHVKIANLGPTAGSSERRRALLLKGIDILVRQKENEQLPKSKIGLIKMLQDSVEHLK
jgi:tetratricopeptide (TPR) repeat protein